MSIDKANKQPHKNVKDIASSLKQLEQEIEFVKFFNKDLLIKGAVNMFSANPGGFKTTFITDICLELIEQGKFEFCYHIDPECHISAYNARNQGHAIKKLYQKEQWLHINPLNFNEKEVFIDIYDFLNYFSTPCPDDSYLKLNNTIFFFDSYGAMIDRNNNVEVSKFLTQCQNLCNNTGTTIIVTTHNNKNGLIYTGGASNSQYASLFYQLHTISRENGKKAIMLECTKSRYGIIEQFMQGYELDFSAQSCTSKRYTIIDDDETSELIKQVYNKANGAVKQIKESKKNELSRIDRIDLIEKIHEVLLSGEKTATQIAIVLEKPKNYAERKLIPLLDDSELLGVRWIKTQNKDAHGRIYDFYKLTIK